MSFFSRLKEQFGSADAAPTVPNGATVIQCERAYVIEAGTGVRVKEYDLMTSDPGSFSSGKHAIVQARQADDYVDIRFDTRHGEAQSLTLYATRTYDGGVFRFLINGKPAGDGDIDMFSKTVTPSGPIELGTFEPELGCFTLRVVAVRPNGKAKAGRCFVGLDTMKATVIDEEA